MGLIQAGYQTVKTINPGSKKRQISDAVYHDLLVNSKDSTDFLKRLNDFKKNESTKTNLISQKIEAEEKRLNLSKAQVRQMRPTQGIKAIKTGGALAATAAITVVETGIKHHFTMQGIKSRDITYQNQIKETQEKISDATSIIGTGLGGAVTGATFGGLYGAIAGGIIGLGYGLYNKVSSYQRESDIINEKIRQSVIEADINRRELGTIVSDGNRGGFR